MQFDELGLVAELRRAIADQGYTIPTPIQAQAIPLILEGRDVLAGAQTGTGKTAAFTLPMLQLLSKGPQRRSASPNTPRALVLTPTRELAAQVAESVATYGVHLPTRSTVIFGGVGINPQKAALRRGVDILVATPGRLLDHAGQRTVDLSAVEILVLDEADRMLDMGFIHDIRRVLALLPRRRQNLLFSATYSADIKRLADNLLHQPALIEVARRNTATELVSQHVYRVDKQAKRDLLVHLIDSGKWSQVLVFTRTKHGANRLAEQLNRAEIEAAAIHGNKSQNARTQALAGFKQGRVRVLVATDIAARGLDITSLPHVVNYELPNEPEAYVHRIGRTGRAGEEGAAVSLVDNTEAKLLDDIQRLLRKTIPVLALPHFDAAVLRSQPARGHTQAGAASDAQGQGRGNQGGSDGNRASGGGGQSPPRRPHGHGAAGEGARFGQRKRRPKNRQRQVNGNLRQTA